MGTALALVEARMAFRAELEDFGSFYERTYQAAYQTAWAILRDRAAAADAVQDAYVSAYRERDRFRGDAPARSWLLRIVVNRALDVSRRSRPPIARLDVALDPVSPADDVARATDHVSLEEAMEALEPRARAAVVLRYYHDLDYATIAAILGTSANNVGVVLHRALARLAGELGRGALGDVVLEEVRRG